MVKISLWIVDKYCVVRRKCGKPVISPGRIHKYRKLYPGKDPEVCARKEDAGFVRQLALATMLMSILLFAVLRMQKEPGKIDHIERPEYGKGEEIVRLEAELGDKETASVEIPIKERVYTKMEADDCFTKAYQEISSEMLGENTSLEHVTEPLFLPEEALEGVVRAEWTSENRELLDDWGDILKKAEEIDPKGEAAVYHLELFCGTFTQIYEIPLVIYPAERTETMLLAERLQQTIQKWDEENKTEKEIPLPAEFEGESIQWYESRESTDSSVMIAVLFIVIILLICGKSQKQKEALKARELELMLDYPELLSKFTVLVQSGMTTRNVWERLVKEYGEKKKKGAKSRYVYEEMEVTWNQLKNGAYESRVYEEFGRRCGIHAYLKFGALLEQNLRQGTTGLALRLKEETEEAFEARKALARRMGEEAGTKLMVPMFMMLAVVLIVVLVPAFLAF